MMSNFTDKELELFIEMWTVAGLYLFVKNGLELGTFCYSPPIYPCMYSFIVLFIFWSYLTQVNPEILKPHSKSHRPLISKITAFFNRILSNLLNVLR